MRSNEGISEIFHGDVLLPVTQTRRDGTWSGGWAEGSPIMIDPPYYPGQKLLIEVDASINGGKIRTLSGTFIPQHITGTETVNLLTM
jgi:hypothetical protein